jgi:pyridoxamine 5'-phosphate oxidase
MSTSIADLRKDYKLLSLDIPDVLADPIQQFDVWFQHALKSDLLEPNAMTLATTTSDGKPSARKVLLKGLDQRGFIFYTNYESRKAKDILDNPFVALCFHWGELERQVRIEGIARKISKEESEAYFHSRPFESRIGAIASKQSSVVNSRAELEEQYQELLKKYEGKHVPMPDFWGGYVIEPHVIEFWQGRSGRMHDRIEYRKDRNSWTISRLSP